MYCASSLVSELAREVIRKESSSRVRFRGWVETMVYSVFRRLKIGLSRARLLGSRSLRTGDEMRGCDCWCWCELDQDFDGWMLRTTTADSRRRKIPRKKGSQRRMLMLAAARLGPMRATT